MTSTESRRTGRPIDDRLRRLETWQARTALAVIAAPCLALAVIVARATGRA